MKRVIQLAFLAFVCAAALAAFQFSRVASVEPDTGKAGDAVVAKGENLDKGKIGELYLTDGKNDVKVSMEAQSAEEIRFKIPQCAAGRYHLMILTANKASMIEQPVVLTVE